MKPFILHPEDGRIKVQFCLPMALNPQAIKQAYQFVEKLQLTNPKMLVCDWLDEQTSYFEIEAQTEIKLDLPQDKAQTAPKDIEDKLVRFAKEKPQTKIKILAACAPGIAYSLSNETTLSWQGLGGYWGLESYPFYQTLNLRNIGDIDQILKNIEGFQPQVIFLSEFHPSVANHAEFFEKIKTKAASLNPKTVIFCIAPVSEHQTITNWGANQCFEPFVNPKKVAYSILENLQ